MVTKVPDPGRESQTAKIEQAEDGVPNFALDLILRRFSAAQIAAYDFDFSAVRAIVLGAERIRPKSMEGFYQLLAPAGLQRNALCPAYGMAENSLIVTGVGWQASPTWLDVRAEKLNLGDVVEVVSHDEPGSTAVMACGSPVSKTTVEIVDDAGAVVQDAVVGEIRVRSDSLFSGYVRAGEFEARDGAFDTGDVGFCLDGATYVIGRLGDSIKHHGATVHAEDGDQGVIVTLPRTKGANHRVPVPITANPSRWDPVTHLQA